MMQYRLRTLLIVLAVVPLYIGATYWTMKKLQTEQAEAVAKSLAEKQRRDREAFLSEFSRAKASALRVDEASPNQN
jgi:broad specificity phosphatase PhoE